VKKCEIQGGSQEMAVMVHVYRLIAKILIMAIQVNLCCLLHILLRFVTDINLPELSLIKFLLLAYHYSHFLAATLDFTSFFTMAFLGAAHFFL